MRDGQTTTCRFGISKETDVNALVGEEEEKGPTKVQAKEEDAGSDWTGIEKWDDLAQPAAGVSWIG